MKNEPEPESLTDRGRRASPPEEPRARREPAGVIVLVGMRCSGKTTVGRALAERLSLPFVDLDRETLRFGRFAGFRTSSVGELLRSAGTARFRDLEATALRKLLEPSQDLVVAAGGGVIEREDNRTWLERTATVVYLSAPPRLLRSRMEADPIPRPGLEGEDPLEEIESLLARRDPLYRAVSDLVVEVGEEPPEALAARIETELVAVRQA